MNSESEQLLALLGNETPPPPPQEPWEDIRVEDLEPPVGVKPEIVSAVKGFADESELFWYSGLIKKLAEFPEDGFIPTGIFRLDEVMEGGLRGGELFVLSGPTKAGKSLICQTISYNQAQMGFPVVWFSFEMGWQELTRKFAKMDEKYQKTGIPTDAPICYPIDNSKLSLKWLEKQIKKAQQENGVFMAFIDHLHFLVPMDTKNMSQAVGAAMRDIKKIAVRLNIPIILIAHTKKLEAGERPDINSPRDSSFVVQEADYLAVIWRERAEEVNPKRKSSWEKTAKSFNRVKDLVESSQFSSTDDFVLYTDKTFVSVEANRRNGQTRCFSVFFRDGKLVELDRSPELEAVPDARISTETSVSTQKGIQEPLGGIGVSTVKITPSERSPQYHD